MTLTRINLLGIDNYLEVSEDVVAPIKLILVNVIRL